MRAYLTLLLTVGCMHTQPVPYNSLPSSPSFPYSSPSPRVAQHCSDVLVEALTTFPRAFAKATPQCRRNTQEAAIIALEQLRQREEREYKTGLLYLISSHFSPTISPEDLEWQCREFKEQFGDPVFRLQLYCDTMEALVPEINRNIRYLNSKRQALSNAERINESRNLPTCEYVSP